jgi:hypothetical protein
METTVKKISWYSFLTLIIVAVIGGVLVFGGKNESVVGGGGLGDFTATTTHYVGENVNKVLKYSPGTLGRVTITKTPTSNFYLYDATSTVPAQRTVTATSALKVLASFPPSVAAGTYEFDEVFRYGLMYITEGAIGTSTILFK